MLIKKIMLKFHSNKIKKRVNNNYMLTKDKQFPNQECKSRRKI